MEKIQKLQNDIQEWSRKTFGIYRTALPVAKHLKIEIDELIEAVENYYKGNYSNSADFKVNTERIDRVNMELADCMILLLDCAGRLPISVDFLMTYVEQKLEINKKRKWKGPDENGLFEHIPDSINNTSKK